MAGCQLRATETTECRDSPACKGKEADGALNVLRDFARQETEHSLEGASEDGGAEGFGGRRAVAANEEGMSTPYEEGLGGNGDVAGCMVLPKRGGRAVHNAEDITDDGVMVIGCNHGVCFLQLRECDVGVVVVNLVWHWCTNALKT